MPPGRSLAAFFFAAALLLFLVLFSPASAASHREAVAGRIELSAVPREPVLLSGQWGFAWQQFIDPRWQQVPNSALAAVPGGWNELQADGKPPGPQGWGSYALQVDCPVGQALALEASPQRTASRLFVNGELVAAHGVPGTSAADTWAAVYNRVPITREFDCPLRITLHLANFDHRTGGFVRPLAVGPADVLAHWRESRTATHAALLAAYGITGLVALIFFAVRRRERTPLVFGLFCLAMGLYADLLGERLLLRPLEPQVSWFAYMRMEYFAWITAMAFFFLTLKKLFPTEISRRAVAVVMALLCAGAWAVLRLPPATYSQLVAPGTAVAALVIAYVVGVVLKSDRRAEARVLLGGMACVLLATLADLLLIDGGNPDRKLVPFGFALFLLSPALVIARRMSQALNAEERSRTLEENARLREDVERISRHDLKTPLNSIIGASRLLQDDPSLGHQQRELVGVLQRAGLRMLEMVNLSLGLYRMETGSYDLRPQTVNLREVVTRVLVDLHSLARGADVTLDFGGGSDRTAVAVRGEELLCYSIIANLVKNAIEATPPGGRVSLSLSPGDPVSLRIHNPGEVRADIAARFFEKYASAGKRGGAGLGTYSARLMARAQRGELTLHTSAAQGTTLTLTLPAGRMESAEARNSAPQPLPAASLDGGPARTLLLVDDDEFSRLVTSQLLPSPPFQVETAENGQVAVEQMMKRWPDVLLLDMEMPVLSGIETLRRVREHEAALALPRCRVVMLSGNDDAASMNRALQAGADRFLVKPVDRDELLATLDALEEQGEGHEAR
ncbi:response regulator [Ramlibacter rhizophilus]|uniref:histidine kinase n=1 Tax=Ramlibacter rhizophilus TaxID=1781167 RepID=A0A4Z0BC40_9BURK|nr:response regulator [Ramlibacter rhizophilus]TFY96796.1 response regulator [Ramlibacter rhizophilus]